MTLNAVDMYFALGDGDKVPDDEDLVTLSSTRPQSYRRLYCFRVPDYSEAEEQLHDMDSTWGELMNGYSYTVETA